VRTSSSYKPQSQYRTVQGLFMFAISYRENEDVLLRVKEQRTILHEIIKWEANWIGRILRRNCRITQVIEGKIKGGIDVIRRRGRRRRKLLNDLK
jgi:hypothetical protein